MKTITKTLPTGIITTQVKKGNTIRIKVETKDIKNKVSKMTLFFQILSTFLFGLATLGISGFSIVWWKSLLVTNHGEAIILFPFIVGVNILVGLLIIHGSRVLKQDFFTNV